MVSTRANGHAEISIICEVKTPVRNVALGCMEYVICTTVNTSTGAQSTEVRHRFSDFLKLHTELGELVPFPCTRRVLNIQPNWLLNYRRAELEKFIVRLLSRPGLGLQNSSLLHFLMLEPLSYATEEAAQSQVQAQVVPINMEAESQPLHEAASEKSAQSQVQAQVVSLKMEAESQPLHDAASNTVELGNDAWANAFKTATDLANAAQKLKSEAEAAVMQMQELEAKAEEKALAAVEANHAAGAAVTHMLSKITQGDKEATTNDNEAEALLDLDPEDAGYWVQLLTMFGMSPRTSKTISAELQGVPQKHKAAYAKAYIDSLKSRHDEAPSFVLCSVHESLSGLEPSKWLWLDGSVPKPASLDELENELSNWPGAFVAAQRAMEKKQHEQGSLSFPELVCARLYSQDEVYRDFNKVRHARSTSHLPRADCS